MAINFECENGHRLKTDDRHAGKKSSCPVCRGPVVVPRPIPERRLEAESPKPLTESGAVRLLGDYVPSTRPPTNLNVNLNLGVPIKVCPRCRVNQPASTRICSNCNLYFGPTRIAGR